MVYTSQIKSTKIRYIAVIVLLITLTMALVGGFGVLWRFFVFLLAVLILSYLWARLNIRNIDGKISEISGHCRVGKALEENFTVLNKGRLPTSLLEIREETDVPGYRNTVTTILSPGSSHSWQTIVNCTRRGRYNTGSLAVRITDPLGLFSISRQIGKNQRIIVYPEIHELPYFQAVPRQEPGSSPRRWLASDISPNAARVREYTSGDSLRHIHWHSTAHTGELMVKEFDPDRSNIYCKNVWIFPDMHSSARTGTGTETIEEYTIMIAASLAKKYVDNRKDTGLVTSGERSYLFLPDTGERHLQNILNTLARVRAAGNIGIDRLLAAETGRIDSGSIVIVITSSDNRGITTALRRVVGRGAIVMVILLDSLSFGGKTNAAATAHALISSGVTVYVVRCGMDIARALDSRINAAHA
jgi:uncharacterized protein (DUF58 family)